MGTCFHVGEGVFVTARHVIENNRIIEIRITEPVGVRASEAFPGLEQTQTEKWDQVLEERLGFIPYYKRWLPPLQIVDGPYFPEDSRIDVAAFRVSEIHPAASVVKIGIHWDDWIYRGQWHLSEAVILGYPPIPLTASPHLVAARAHIHTYVVPVHSPFVHFIISATARGGFSGGPAILQDGYLLGVVTSSLLRNNQPSELGFQAVLSVEPLRVLLDARGLMPRIQRVYERQLLDGKK